MVKRKTQKNFDKDILCFYVRNNEFSSMRYFSDDVLPNDLKESMVQLWILMHSS